MADEKLGDEWNMRRKMSFECVSVLRGVLFRCWKIGKAGKNFYVCKVSFLFQFIQRRWSSQLLDENESSEKLVFHNEKHLMSWKSASTANLVKRWIFNLITRERNFSTFFGIIRLELSIIGSLAKLCCIASEISQQSTFR